MPKDLSFPEYIAAIRNRGYKMDADELEVRVPEELGVTANDLKDVSWEEIELRLMAVRTQLLEQAAAPFIQDPDDVVMFGAGVDPEVAKKIMFSQNAAWDNFKKKQMQ